MTVFGCELLTYFSMTVLLHLCFQSDDVKELDMNYCWHCTENKYQHEISSIIKILLFLGMKLLREGK